MYKATIFNKNDCRSYKTFYKLFCDVANQYPEHTSIESVNRKLSYHALRNAIDSFAQRLAKTIVLHHKDKKQPFSNVECLTAIYLPRGPEFIVAIFACMQLEIPYLPIDTMLPNDVISDMLSESKSHWIIVDPMMVKNTMFPQTCQQISFDDSPFSVSDDFRFSTDNQLMYVMYTSGSTGKPKGVMIGPEGLTYCLAAHDDVIRGGIKPNDKVAQFSSKGFDASVAEFIMLGKGATLVMVPSELQTDYEKLTQFYRQHKITIAIFTPKSLENLNPNDFPDLRALFIVGATFPKELADKWLSKTRQVFNGFGLTETTVCTHINECTKDKELSIGKPIKGFTLQLRPLNDDEDNTSLTSDILDKIQWISPEQQGKEYLGELFIEGIGLAKGYWRRDDLTQSRFIYSKKLNKTFYRTGDIGYFNNNGELIITGRCDRQLKIRGQRIELDHIENCIQEFKEIKQACVIAKKNETGNLLLVAYLVPHNKQLLPKNIEKQQTDISLTENATQLLKKLSLHCKQKLPSYAVPGLHQMILIDELPMKSQSGTKGGIDYKKIQQWPLSRQKRLTIFRPRDEIEKKIHQIWAELLNFPVEALSIYDDFFALGGDSILFGQMLVKIQAFSKQPIERTVFLEFFSQHGSIATIRSFLYRQAAEKDSPCILLKQAINPQNPPFYLVHSLMGDPQEYTQLINYFAPTQDIVGLQLRKSIGIYPSLNLIALDYVQAILSLHPKGKPFYLIGYSSGGTIALEMAKFLKKFNLEYQVIMIDTVCPTVLSQLSLEEHRQYLKKLTDKILNFFQAYYSLDLKVASYISSDSSKINFTQSCDHQGQIRLYFTQLIASFVVHEKDLKKRQLIVEKLLQIQSLCLAELAYEVSNTMPDYHHIVTTESIKQSNEQLAWSSPSMDKITVSELNHFQLLAKEGAEKTARIISDLMDNSGKKTIKDRLKAFYQRQSSCSLLLYEDKTFSLENLFVNISIVKEEEQKLVETKEIGAKKENRDEHLSSWESIHRPKNPIKNENFFAQLSEEKTDPKKILLLGRAGIGKSLFSLYLGYQCTVSEKPLWNNKFDAIFFIRLRWLPELLKTKKSITIADVLYEQCLRLQKDEECDQEKIIENLLKNYLSNNNQKEKILIILDGWDEIDSHQHDEKLNPLLKELLDFPNVLVTSRPYARPTLKNQQRELIFKADRVLEHMGFLPENLEKYIDQFFKLLHKETLATSLKSFIQKNISIQSLMFIPLNAELVCSLWENYNKKDEPLSSSLSLSELYILFVDMMSRRYLSKRSKFPLAEDEVVKLSQIRVKDLCNDIYTCLEEIAFERMTDEKLSLLTPYAEIEKLLPRDCAITDLLEAQFIKGLGDGTLTHQFYYFLHLTFQEYFAAMYLARALMSKDEKKWMDAFHFIRLNKYESRYEVMLWFVAGHIKRDKVALERFWEAILAEPRDCIGVNHLKLLMICFEQCCLDEKSGLVDFKQCRSIYNMLEELPKKIHAYIKNNQLDTKNYVYKNDKQDVFFISWFEKIRQMPRASNLLYKNIIDEKFMREEAYFFYLGVVINSCQENEIAKKILRKVLAELDNSKDDGSLIIALALFGLYIEGGKVKEDWVIKKILPLFKSNNKDVAKAAIYHTYVWIHLNNSSPELIEKILLIASEKNNYIPCYKLLFEEIKKWATLNQLTETWINQKLLPCLIRLTGENCFDLLNSTASIISNIIIDWLKTQKYLDKWADREILPLLKNMQPPELTLYHFASVILMEWAKCNISELWVNESLLPLLNHDNNLLRGTAGWILNCWVQGATEYWINNYLLTMLKTANSNTQSLLEEALSMWITYGSVSTFWVQERILPLLDDKDEVIKQKARNCFINWVKNNEIKKDEFIEKILFELFENKKNDFLLMDALDILEIQTQRKSEKEEQINEFLLPLLDSSSKELQEKSIRILGFLVKKNEKKYKNVIDEIVFSLENKNNYIQEEVISSLKPWIKKCYKIENILINIFSDFKNKILSFKENRIEKNALPIMLNNSSFYIICWWIENHATIEFVNDVVAFLPIILFQYKDTYILQCITASLKRNKITGQWIDKYIIPILQEKSSTDKIKSHLCAEYILFDWIKHDNTDLDWLTCHLKLITDKDYLYGLFINNVSHLFSIALKLIIEEPEKNKLIANVMIDFLITECKFLSINDGKKLFIKVGANNYFQEPLQLTDEEVHVLKTLLFQKLPFPEFVNENHEQALIKKPEKIKAELMIKHNIFSSSNDREINFEGENNNEEKNSFLAKNKFSDFNIN